MIIDKVDNAVIISQEKVVIKTFVANIKDRYNELQNENIIVNLFSFNSLQANDILEFLTLSDAHKGGGKSFVLVTDKVVYDDVPDAIDVVPTLQEAHDLIEMEEIERDLGI